MNLEKIFNKTQKILLVLFFILITIGSIYAIKKYSINALPHEYIEISILYIAFTILSMITLFIKIDEKKKICVLFLIGLILRIVWVLKVPTILASDYKTIYNTALEFLSGNIQTIKGYEYLSRFPHLIPTMIYMASIIFLFPSNNLFIMKIINIILSMVSMFLILKISEFVLDKKESKPIIVVLSAINVVFISFVSTYCTENIAIPLFLFAILTFFRTLKLEKKQFIGIIFTGILLSIGNLFREVAIIFLIAYVLYITFYTSKNKIRNIIILVLTYIITNIIISYSLIGLRIIERPLWIGTEPKITSVLKGTNIKTYGMWNGEDASFVTDNLENPELQQMCIEKIKERITSLSISEFILFYGGKLLVQWTLSDSGGVFWATYDLTNNISNLTIFQIIGTIYMILGLASLFRKNNNEMRLLHILLIGIVSLFLIIETQSRYSYIISWVYIFMASKEIENIIQKIKNKKVYLLNEKNK